jgi:hypothetical protein
MLNGSPIWVRATILGLALIGLGLLIWSWKLARSSDKVAKSGVISSVGSGLVTSSVVSFALLLVQASMENYRNEAQWRDSLVVASTLNGFDPRGHSVENLNLSGKILIGAKFDSKNLADSQLNDTDLRSSTFYNADLRRVNLRGSNLSTAEFNGADLSGADLRGADLSYAAIETAKTLKGATADANTCWPEGFMETKLFKEVKATSMVIVERGERHKTDPERGVEQPDCDQRH